MYRLDHPFPDIIMSWSSSRPIGIFHAMGRSSSHHRQEAEAGGLALAQVHKP